MKHKVTLTIADDNGQTTVLRGAQRRLPVRLLRFLFGDFTQVYMLSPGKSVRDIDVKEVNDVKTE